MLLRYINIISGNEILYLGVVSRRKLYIWRLNLLIIMLETVGDSREKDVLAYASELEIIVSQINRIQEDMGKVKNSFHKEPYREKIECLESEAAKFYGYALKPANQIYSSWPKPKQIRAGRQMRVAMEDAGEWSHGQQGTYGIVEEIQKGKIGCLRKRSIGEVVVKLRSLKTIPYAFRELVRENRNPDATDPYWDIIKGSFTINGGCGEGELSFGMENGNGSFESISWRELFGIGVHEPEYLLEKYSKLGILDWKTPFLDASMEKLRFDSSAYTRYIIDKLVGKKVFFGGVTRNPITIDFVPPKDSTTNDYNYEPIFVELNPYECMGKKYSGDKSQVFDSFTERDAINTKHLLSLLETHNKMYWYNNQYNELFSRKEIQPTA